MLSFSNAHSLWWYFFSNSPAKWLTNALLSLGQYSLSNAYPPSTHGSVHRIIALSQNSSQLLVAFTFNGTLPSMRLPHNNPWYKVILHALCPQRVAASAHNSLPSPLRLDQNYFHHNMLPSTHSWYLVIFPPQSQSSQLLLPNHPSLSSLLTLRSHKIRYGAYIKHSNYINFED